MDLPETFHPKLRPQTSPCGVLGRRSSAADDDQAAADWDQAHGLGAASHERTAAVRAGTSLERMEISELRDQTAEERDKAAQRRDELSMRRDELAELTEEEAKELDRRDEIADRYTVGVEELRARAQAVRIRAANDRVRAARHRKQAARDREQAARDREQAAYERTHAGTDELTGARRRGVGLEELENEIQRARRTGQSLVAIYVDVDGLKSVNDEQGHRAGDEMLRSVVNGLCDHLRPYDLIIRLGGDEFLCVLPTGLDEARLRVAGFRSDLSESVGASVSVGFSELCDGETLQELIDRADHDLLTTRKVRTGFAPK